MRKFKKSERGVLTVQFMVAIVLVLFFIVSFLGLTMTLTYSSLTQYLTYASARKLSLGGRSKGHQVDAGKLKYQTIRQGIFGSSFQPGGTDWFAIPEAQLEFNSAYSGQEATTSSPGARRLFYGTYVFPFQSNISNFTVPFLTGETSGDLITTVGSYLGREPSINECEDFLSTAKTLFPLSKYPGNMPQRSLTPFFSDNGC